MHFGLCGTYDMMNIFSFVTPFLPGILRYLTGLLLDWGPKFVKIGIAIGVIFGGAYKNNGNNTHLLQIMCTRLSQKIGLHDLTNRNQLETRKWLGTTYANNFCLLRNLYHNMYAHLITTSTHMLISSGCVSS